MKTITEAAKEHSLKKNTVKEIAHTLTCEDFKAGVEFSQQWIKVEDETPLAYETGEWDGKRSVFVLAKNKFGNVYIARTYEGVIDGNKFCYFAEKDDTIISHIIEWRPIYRF